MWTTDFSICARYFVDDPKFTKLKYRVKNHKELKELIEEWATQYTVREALEMVDGIGVPCAPIYDVAQVVADPHIAEDRQMFVETEYPLVGKIKLTASQIKLSATPPSIRTPAPTLEQHNNDVFGKMLGLSAAQIAELKSEGII